MSNFNLLIMSGKDLKKILADEGIAISELARLLGFANDQRLHSALKAEDVKSGLIEEIARVTNKSICLFYPDTAGAVASDNSVAVSGDGNSVTTISEKFISLLERKDEQMDRLITIIEDEHSHK